MHLPLELGEDDAARAGRFGLEDVVGIQLRATPTVAGQRLFIGIAAAHDLRTYLQGVPHSIDRNELVDLPGARAPAPPAELFGLTNQGALIAGLVGLVLGLALLGGVSRRLRSRSHR